MANDRRRRFLIASGSLLSLPITVHAFSPDKIWRIGVLNPGLAAQAGPYTVELRRGLQELGQAEGRNFIPVERHAEGKNERLPELAAELVRLKVDVIIAITTNAVRVAQKTTATIPIVFVAVSDPVGSGFADSLFRPGRNMTGMSNFAGDLAPKRLELLSSAMPQLSRIAFLVNPTNPLYEGTTERLRAAAGSMGLSILPVNSTSAEDIDSAFATMRRENAMAAVVGGDVYHFQNRSRIVEAAIKHHIALIAPFAEYAAAGGLMSYGTNVAAQFRRLAAYVDQIMKGAKAGDLPIEQPAVFEFVINLKTAKTLGITIPQSLLVRADAVIQ